jgi:cation diffusion facilitator CzcD-associated flavoprotein CzcO
MLERVVIIGGGPSGIIQTKYLKDSCEIYCFESRNSVGG